MGMSASQVRLLTITKRIHEVENEAERTQNQKMLLGLQSDEAYEEYLAAMEMKNIEYAWFNGDTGNFEWDKLTIQSLFDNGYHLKVKQIAPQTVVTANAPSISSMGGSIIAADTTVPISGTATSLFIPNANNTTYTSTVSNTLDNSVTASTNLLQVYANSLALNNDFINNFTPRTEAELIQDGYYKIDGNTEADYQNYDNARAQGQTKFYLNVTDIKKFMSYTNSRSLDWNNCEIVLVNNNPYGGGVNQAKINTPFRGTLDGNGCSLMNSSYLSTQFIDELDGGTIKNLKFYGNGQGNLLVNKVNNGLIDNCVIIEANMANTVNDSNANLIISNTYVNDRNANHLTMIQNLGVALDTGASITIDNCYVTSGCIGTTTYNSATQAVNGFIGGNQDQGNGTINITNSYTNAQNLASSAITLNSTNNSFTTDSIELNFHFENPDNPLDTQDFNNVALPDFSTNSTIQSIINDIQTAIQGTPGFDNATVYLDDNKIAIRTPNKKYKLTNVTSQQTNSLLNMVSLLGLNGVPANMTSAADYNATFDGAINFDITENNNNPPHHYSIPLSGTDSLDNIILKIKNAIAADFQNSTVEIVNNAIEIKIADNDTTTYSVGSFIQIMPTNYESSILGQDIITQLGLDSIITSPSTIPSTTTIQDPDYQFHECSSPAEVLQHLGSGIDINDPLVLRELIYNAYAIIMAPIYDEDLGHSIMQETSVATNVGLREKTDNTMLAQAEANYEAALRRIDKKEEQYDKDLAKYDQERKALTSELDTLKTCIKENIDRTFKIFQG